MAKNVFGIRLLGSPFSGHFSASNHGRRRYFSARKVYLTSDACDGLTGWV